MTAPLTRVALDDPDRAAGPPIDERLFSQFFEHMAAATAGGLSAELLANPTLVRDAGLTPEQVETLRLNERLIASWLAGDAGPMRDRWTSAPLHGGFPASLVEEPRFGLPLGWATLGWADAVSHCTARVGDGVRVRAMPGATGLDSPVAMLDEAPGLRQGIRIPTDRCRRVSIRVVCRATHGSGTLEVLLRRRQPGLNGSVGEVLGRARATISTDGWSTTEHELAVPDDLARTDLVDLLLRWHTTDDSADLVLDRVSAMPSDHICGLDPEVIELAKAARIPELRWPGGNFASYYHWQDGIGPADLRPTRPNHAWGGIEQNQIGTEEFLLFARLIGAEPHITVNSGTGSAEEAADWVEYCNGAVTTRMGALRARTGHPEPHDVRIWEVGNENFGAWQGGFVGSEENARRFAEHAAAMRSASPVPLQLHACGNAFDFEGADRRLDAVVSDGRWHAELLRQAPDDVDVISLHALPVNDAFLDGLDEEDVHHALMAYVTTVERAHMPQLLAECDASARRADLPPIRVSWTEWAPVGSRRDRVRCENAGGSVWGIDFLGMLTRFGERIAMASPNGLLHGGAIKKGGGGVYTDPVFDIVGRMRSLAGHVPVAAVTEGPTFDVEHPTDLGRAERAVPFVGVSACVAPGVLTCLLISRRAAGEDRVRVALPQQYRSGTASAHLWCPTVAGEHASPANPQPVTWSARPVTIESDAVELDLPAGSALWIEVTEHDGQ